MDRRMTLQERRDAIYDAEHLLPKYEPTMEERVERCARGRHPSDPRHEQRCNLPSRMGSCTCDDPPDVLPVEPCGETALHGAHAHRRDDREYDTMCPGVEKRWLFVRALHQAIVVRASSEDEARRRIGHWSFGGHPKVESVEVSDRVDLANVHLT